MPTDYPIMIKKKLLCAALFGLVLGACSEQDAPLSASAAQTASAASEPAANLCIHPALAAQVQENLSNLIETEARDAEQRSIGKTISAAKLVSAVGRFKTEAAEPRFDPAQNACAAQITVNIPAEVLDTAATFAPLLKADSPQNLINRHLTGSNSTFSGQTLSFPLNYSLENGGIRPTDTTLRSNAKILADALMPYAVKDTVTVNGKTMKREEALRRLNEPEKASEPQAAAVEEVPSIGNTIPAPPDPAQMQQNGADPLPVPAPESISPDKPKRSRITQAELDSAQRAHNEAGAAIKNAWRNIEPEVQRELVDDQRTWEQKKEQSCSKAAAKGADQIESQYLRWQCDTRMTRERTQKLRGYSIE